MTQFDVMTNADLDDFWAKIKANFVSALGTSGNNLTWTKNGTTSNITVPFATTASKLGTAKVGDTFLPIYLNNGTPTAVTSVGEAYLSFGGKNLTQYPSPLDISLLQEGHNNYAAFAPADHVTIEYSQDGGATWADYGASDANKTYLFTRCNTSFIIGKNTSSTADFTNYQLRVTLNTEGLMNTFINKFLIQARRQGSSGSWCTIETRTQENKENNVDTWEVQATRVSLSDYWNTINLSDAFQTYASGSTKTPKGQIRFTFGVTGYTSGKTGLRIYNIYCYGRLPLNVSILHSNMAWTGHLYGFDYLQNATFPANVSATKFNNLTLTAASTGFTIAGGTTSKTLTVNETYTLGDACAKDVDTSLAVTSTSTNLPTSRAVATLVSGYLPLTGGTIASASFGAFAVQRNHTTRPAGIAFKHYSSGTTVETMGYLAMSTKDGPFTRYNGAASTPYIMWDGSNSNLETVDWTCRDILVNRNIELPACTASENYLFRIGSKNMLQVNSQGNTVFNFGYSGTSGNNLLLYANASQKFYVGSTKQADLNSSGLNVTGGVSAGGIVDLGISGGGGQSGYADEAGLLSSLNYQTYAHSNASTTGSTTFTNLDTFYKDTASEFSGTKYTFNLPVPTDTKRHVIVIHFVHVSGDIDVNTTNNKVAYTHDFINWKSGETFDDAHHYLKCEWMYDMWLVTDYVW